jgi:hypothetical protein
VNKKDATSRENFSKRKIALPVKFLKAGANVVEIYFENQYSRVENGFHTFIDSDEVNLFFDLSQLVSIHLLKMWSSLCS